MAALDYLNVNGLHAYVEAGRLHVWPASKLTDELRSWIRSNRDRIICEACNDSELRNCWYVSIGCNTFPMIRSGGMTRSEALAAARAKWPDAVVN